MAKISEMIDAISLQLVIVIVLGAVSIMISHSIYSGISTFEELMSVSYSPLSIVSMLLSIASLVTVGWAGYAWAKESKGTAVDGGKAGALVSAISGLITGILSMIYVYPAMSRLFAAAGIPQMSGTSVLSLVSLIFGIIISAVIGFIIGYIGGHYGSRKR